MVDIVQRSSNQRPEDSDLSWWQLLNSCAGMTPTDQNNHRRFRYWNLLWAVSILASAWILKNIEQPTVGSIAAALVPALIGVFTLLSYWRFLRLADELTRNIQLQGIAIGFAAGIVALSSIILLERAGVASINPGIPIVVMLFAFGFGQLLASTRYQ